MTKIYEGSGIYTVHLSSGKTIELTEDEINEISENSQIVEDAEVLEDEIKQMLNSIEEQMQYIREIEDDIIPKLDECSNYIRKASYKEEYRKIVTSLEGVMGELGSLGS